MKRVISAIIFLFFFLNVTVIFSSSKTFSPPQPDVALVVKKNQRYFPYSGNTIFADYHKPNRPRIIEVNMKGWVVWEYLLPDQFRQFTNPGFDVEYLKNTDHILFVLPRKGVFEIDRNGNIVWSYKSTKVSHDADRLENGNTLIVFGSEDTKNDAQVIEVDTAGHIVWEWRAIDYFNKPPLNNIYKNGWTHTNEATRLKDGNTIINLRNFDYTIKVNPSGKVLLIIDWTKYGQNPYSPVFLPKDRVLIAMQNPHRVLEFNLKSGEIVWQFSHPKIRTIRDIDRLPNGNTLIVEQTGIIEVTRDYQVVWHLDIKGASRNQRDRSRWLYNAERIKHK